MNVLAVHTFLSKAYLTILQVHKLNSHLRGSEEKLLFTLYNSNDNFIGLTLYGNRNLSKN